MLNRLLGLPKNAAEHGFQLDQMMEFIHWVMLVLFVGWSCFFLYSLFRFHRSRSPKADYYGVKSKASTHIEFMVVLVETVFLLGFAIPLWGKRVNGTRPDQDFTRIRLIAEQFSWNFHYSGKDGIFGRQKIELVTTANPLGLDYTDPAAKDDLVVKNEAHIPVNKNVIFDISSKDVIHSFALKAMRIAQDATPGLVIPMWFKPIDTGSFEIVCGQLCGTNHYAMKGTLVVDTPEAYQEWLDEMAQLSANAQPAAPAAPAAEPAAAAPATPAAPEAAPAAVEPAP